MVWRMSGIKWSRKREWESDKVKVWGEIFRAKNGVLIKRYYIDGYFWGILSNLMWFRRGYLMVNFMC